MNSMGFLETFWQDVQFGLRMLWKTPGFTLVVILSLALGIGANTAIFTLVDAALLRMLPVKNPEQLIELNPMDVATGQPTAFSYPAFEAIRDGSKVFSGVFTFNGGGNLGNIDVEVDGHGGIAAGQYVSGNYFATLGVEPFLGRVISPPDDDPPSGNPVAVISYGYWKSRFGGDQSILGKRITLNNSPFTIVGVAPPEFFGMQPGTSVNLWVPLMTISQVRPDFAMAGTPNAVFVFAEPQLAADLLPVETRSGAGRSARQCRCYLRGCETKSPGGLGKCLILKRTRTNREDANSMGTRQQRLERIAFAIFKAAGDSHGGCWSFIADCLCECGEYAARQSWSQAQRDCRANCAWRRASPVVASINDGKRFAGTLWRSARNGNCVLG